MPDITELQEMEPFNELDEKEFERIGAAAQKRNSRVTTIYSTRTIPSADICTSSTPGPWRSPC